jgi:hypothetical protein
MVFHLQLEKIAKQQQTMLKWEVRHNDNKSSSDEFSQARKQRGKSIICDWF